MGFREKDLELLPAPQLNVIKFDDPSTHGLTSFDMKAVDFIIDFPDKYVFLELKDPDDPNARTKSKQKFIEEFKSDTLKSSLAKKYRDSFIYRWAQDKIDKPIYYYVIVCSKSLKPPDYLILTEKLKKYLPLKYDKAWRRQFASNCIVLNLSKWNEIFPDCKIRRVSLMPQY
jgi:hypothetical protein